MTGTRHQSTVYDARGLSRTRVRYSTTTADHAWMIVPLSFFILYIRFFYES